MNCHTMKTKIFIFFALVSCFRGFAEEYADCEQNKSNALDFLLRIESASSSISAAANDIAFAANSDQYTIQGQSRNIQYYSSSISFHAGELSTFVSSIQCSSNDTCSVDLGPLATICSNIYDVVLSEYSVLSNCNSQLSLIYETSEFTRVNTESINSILGAVTDINGGYGYLNAFDSRLFNAVSNFNNDVSYSFNSLTNQILVISDNLSTFQLQFSQYHNDFLFNISRIITSLQNSLTSLNSIYQFLTVDLVGYLEYLRYLEGISQDISYLATNEYFNVNVLNLTNYFVSRSSNIPTVPNSLYWRIYDTGLLYNQRTLQPYNSLATLRTANLSESVQGGFVNLLTATSSLNNYFYWLMNYLSTNKIDYSEITTGLANLTNILNRVDDYVLGDFSNQFYHVFECIDTLVSNSLDKVDYTTNLVEITQQLYTNNNHLASIDSKLDVLGYIKVLSDTPLSDFSGDSYYDYLTNLYLTGGSSSSVSTNWFERIEILLASLVFGDSVSSNISTDVEFSNFSEDKVRDAFNDYTFQNELNSGIDLVENTGENFLTILRGFHNALASVSQPQSISIGIGGIDGGDTLSFEDAQHGHFQVSFSSGASDNFTLIVRSMTTIIWILFTMMFIYFSARWLLFKVLFFYRLMRTLITSLFLK